MAPASVSNDYDDGFSTYTEYIKALAQGDPQFSWLASFFSYRPLKPVSTAEISIVDIENGTLKDTPFLLDELAVSPPCGSTRLVILSYDEAWGIERDIHDGLAMTLNLPPYFLWQHFAYENNANEPSAPKDQETRDEIPSPPRGPGSLSLEVGWTQFLHMSGMVVPPQSTAEGTVSK